MSHSKIKKVLIANRGEIALRIKRACDALSISTALVVSDPDIYSLAARDAEEIVPLGGTTARESYLDIEKIIKAAKSSSCDAIHPGYGFLSENADFAQRVEDEGLIFIGPKAASIRALGNKPNARRAAKGAGVPITEGSEGITGDHELLEAAKRIGFPIILKAAAGGGGRGMRIVREAGEFKESIERARAEALKNFGSEEVYFEQFIEEPRHVEVQLFGDSHGTIVHFGTRDCSAQRRHQKLVEEAPAPFLSKDTRERIHAAAINAAKSVGYQNAGTAEFLVKGDSFYFLEINTRIQVEHPVTETITGVDLVQLQLKVAMGEPLPLTQEEIRFEGHAIEYRINAEDPAEGFRPSVGNIGGWKRGKAIKVREDCGYEPDDEISPYYDSLISKVIISGKNRNDALSKSFQFFRDYKVTGIPTSIPFHKWIVCNKEFQEDGIDIGYVERNFTAQCIDEVDALYARDYSHRVLTPHDEATFAEVERVSLSLEGGAVMVDLIHEPGGTFLAIPYREVHEQYPKKYWKRSLNRKTALMSVEEALQKELRG
jgi:acetyl-CoA carboxylase biotin carboxylase subunit